MKKMKKKLISWTDFGNLCQKLFESVMGRNYEGIIGIGRGGSIIGGILSAKTGTRLYSIFVLHRGTGDQKTTRVLDLSSLTRIKSGRYLLVDDHCVTGDTFELLKEELADLTLDTAALVGHGTAYCSDFYAMLTEEQALLPYEY